MKIILLAIILLASNAFAGTVIFEGTVPQGVTFQKAYAYYKYSNCPYFCHDNSVSGKLSVKGTKFKLSLPFTDRIRLTDFRYLTVTFKMKTKSGDKVFQYYLPAEVGATENIVVNDYPISCSMKLESYGQWETEASGCTSPAVKIGYKTTTTLKNVNVTLEENQFEDGVLLVDETFPGKYGVKIYDNGIKGVGVRSKFLLNHKSGGGFLPKGEYRVHEISTSKDGELLHAKIFSPNFELEGYFTTAPLHPEQNTYIIPSEEIRAKCPQAKMAWIMKKFANDDRVVTCL